MKNEEHNISITNEEKIRKTITNTIVLASIIALFGCAMIIWVLGFARYPVFFEDGKLVQLVDTRAQTKSMALVQATVPDPIKEMEKLVYCLQSLQPRMSTGVARIIAKHTYEECKEKNINVSLWVALMFVESSLDPMKSSNAGADGLCGVRYVVWKEQPELLNNSVSVKDRLFWIDLNIKCGTQIFKKFYIESKNSIGVALWRYNSGQPKLPENKNGYNIEYVAKIMYYTYKVEEILAQEESKLHIITDVEVQAEITTDPLSLEKEKTKKLK